MPSPKYHADCKICIGMMMDTTCKQRPADDRTDSHATRVRIGIILPQDRVTRACLTIPDVPYTADGDPVRAVTLTARIEGTSIVLDAPRQSAKHGHSVGQLLTLSPATPAPTATLTLHNCIAGRGFHWSKHIDVALPGRVELSVKDGHLLVVNDLDIESYLEGVITAEMSGDAPTEFLKAQCIVARSWMRAATERKHSELGIDFCNDDCCQRYQGIGAVTESAAGAVDQTAGRVLIHTTGGIVDANYAKSCGGITEAPEHVWGAPKPGQHSTVDAPRDSAIARFGAITETNIAEYTTGPWLGECDAYCSPGAVPDRDLPRYLGRVDDGGGHFRWHIRYSGGELTDLLRRTLRGDAELQIRHIQDLVVTHRGRSGRAIRLVVAYDDNRGRRQATSIEGQYRIRDALHESFLFSSAFDVRIERDAAGRPKTIDLFGAGWGHGAGMCQIGALGMALAGHDHRRILHHYFKDVTIASDPSLRDA